MEIIRSFYKHINGKIFDRCWSNLYSFDKHVMNDELTKNFKHCRYF